MHTLAHINDLVHHAYLFINAKAHKIIAHLEEHHSIKAQGNPDFFHEKYESLGIDDSRRIQEMHSSKSFVEGSRRIFIIECSTMTHEAQNSLLKVFEEPHEFTHFILIMPSVENLLPTLRSRVYIVPEERDVIDTTHAESFLKLPLKERIAFVDAMAEKISEDELTKSDALKFLAELEYALYKVYGAEKREAFKSLLKARDYMSDRSPSVKQLLEYVALIV